MYLKWYVYPSIGQVLSDHLGSLPSVPSEVFGNYITYISPVWDADLQQYVDEYINRFVGFRVKFEETFNCSCSHHLEVHHHKHENITFSNLWLREFINCNGQISLFCD